MKIYFATSNKRKITKAQTSLAKYGIKIEQIDMSFSESRSKDTAMIAREKAEQAYKSLKKPVLVEDSGFFIRVLNGFPTAHVGLALKLGVKNIIKMMKGRKDRHAEWQMSLAYVWGKNKHKIFTFTERGKIASKIKPVKSKIWTDLWKIYIPDDKNPQKHTLSEMTDTELILLREYLYKNNHFAQFGKWFINKHTK